MLLLPRLRDFELRSAGCGSSDAGGFSAKATTSSIDFPELFSKARRIWTTSALSGARSLSLPPPPPLE
eukprot:7757169-Pyramimonas_sp.AAC.1